MNYHGEPYLSSRTGFIGRIRSDRTGFTGRRCVAGAVSQARCLPGKRRVHRLPGGAAAAAGTHTHTQTSPAAAAGAAAQRETEKQLEKTGQLARARTRILVYRERPANSLARACARARDGQALRARLHKLEMEEQRALKTAQAGARRASEVPPP